MAKIQINYDSESKSVTVSVDGQMISDVAEFSGYVEENGEYGYVDIVSRYKEQNGVVYQTRICAAEKSHSKVYASTDKTLVKEKRAKSIAEKVHEFFGVKTKDRG